MALSLQAVHDPATDQNFRTIADQFPIGADALIATVLRLLEGKGSVDLGSSSVTFAGTNEATKTVAHDLGRVPIFTFPVLNMESGSYLMAANRAGSASKTEVTFQFNVPNGGTTSGTFSFGWLAIG